MKRVVLRPLAYVLRNGTKFALFGGAIYATNVYGVWDTSESGKSFYDDWKKENPDFFTAIEKRTIRTGWKLRNVNQPENVSDHMYRMSLMSLVLPETVKIDHVAYDINKNKITKLAIVHDLAECIVGDITPECGVSAEEKYRREKEAMTQLCNELKDNEGQEIMSLWNEYSERQTPEAIVCKDLDRYEMILQAYEYEQQEKKPKFLEEFFQSTETGGKFRLLGILLF